MKNLEFFGLSYIGRRSNNEDSFLSHKFADDIYFFAIADGMGGANFGEIASKLVIKTSFKILTEEIPQINASKDLKEILERIFYSSQEQLRNQIKNDPSRNGMGSTLVCLLIYKGVYVWGNIGDSRLYKANNLHLQALTLDHTHVQEFLKDPDRQLPKSVLSKYGTFLSRALDGGNDKPDIYPLGKDYEILEKDTLFLLCSDGLINDKSSIKNENIENYLFGIKALKESAEQLISSAYYNGCQDNITVILAEFGKTKRKTTTLNKYCYPVENE